MEFNINDFLEDNVAVHCRTQKEAKEFFYYVIKALPYIQNLKNYWIYH